MVQEEQVRAAVSDLLEAFRGNTWFSHYWDENWPRVRLILEDLHRYCPSQSSRVLDIGCGNGYISYLCSRLGYSVTATDAWEPPEREALFKTAGIAYFPSNLNEASPFRQLQDESFDAVILGEVFEHLLNHPVGILREIHRVLSPRGILILTTPNPSTIMNAIRIAFDRHTLWGTDKFLHEPKISDGRIIDNGSIHYREYRIGELTEALKASGFLVVNYRHLCQGSSRAQPALKRLVKKIFLNNLMTWRPFASGHYVVAQRPAANSHNT